MAEQTIEHAATEPGKTFAPVTHTQPAPSANKPVNGYWWGTGRRKRAVARVRVRTGEGKFLVKGREVDQYFTQERDRKAVRAPLDACECSGKVDVFVNVTGGGFTGQAGAVVLGIARALKVMDTTLEPALRNGEYLTRDPRMVERKKYGRRGARRSFQFSKR